MRNIAFVCIALIAVPACTGLGPPYRTPVHELPVGWKGAPADGTVLPAERWWRVYEDATLNGLMQEALAKNADLSAAIARVDEARARLGAARADRFPNVSAQAETRRERLAEQVVPSGGERTLTSTSIGLVTSYEIDLWGRYRGAQDSARAELLASGAARDAVGLALTAQLAQSYFSLLALDEQIAITTRTIATRQEGLELESLRFNAGAISSLDLRQFEAELASAQALLPELEVARARTVNALSVLLGRSPAQVVAQEISRQAFTPLPVVVPSALPSELLQRRPDVREAEQRLIAAHARIGAARAAYFPQITLTGALGGVSSSLSDLFSGPGGVWRFAASVAQPIFDAGRRRADVRITQAQQRQLLAQYQQSVRSAFRDVQDALAAQQTAVRRLQAETERAQALEQALRMAQLRYDNGVASLLDVLDAERNLLSARLNRVEALRTRHLAIADLAKALGGGWQPVS